MFRKKVIVLALMTAITVVASGAAIAGSKRQPNRTAFKVRVENIADPAGITAQDGSRYPYALSPGFYIVSNKYSQIFESGKRASGLLEAQAEDGNPALFYKRFLTRVGSLYTGVFDKPIGKEMAMPIFAGDAFEFDVYAKEGMKLNVAFMYGQSNDLFYAPDQAIDLFDSNGDPFTGDITDLFKLWDAGTEANQAPGLGPDQGPRQKGPNMGTAEDSVVKLVDDGFVYPSTKSVLRVTITTK